MLKKDKNAIEDRMVNLELLDQQCKLGDEQYKELEDLYEESAKDFRVGNVITGKVVSKENNNVLVDISFKSDGLISAYEFSEFELKKLKIGDDVEVFIDYIEDEDGNVVLSYQKAKSLKAWDKILEQAEKDEPVRGIVTNKVKGGLSVDVGIPAFLPGSQVDMQRVNDFDHFVGTEVVCKILKVNKKRGNVIVSRRKYLEEQRYEDKKKALEVIEADQVLQGVVKNITNYGVFVDVGGIDGLLHITDMSWGRIAHPSELVKIGDTITVKVVSFDKEHEKISLGMKQLESNPWVDIEGKYAIGSKIKGRIASITDYGLFVEIDKGIEGLVHISEVSWTERISNLSKHYSVGDEIEVVAVALDEKNRRMSLSIKRLEDDPWKVVADKFKIGDKVTGPISNITDFGVFVSLYDGVDGLAHISDISWTEHIVHPGDRYKKGEEITAVVLAMDIDNRKISLGIKQLESDPWQDINEQYPVGKIVEGVVSKVTNFGAFIKLESGIEGLVHISELSDKEVEKVEDIIQVGQKAEFKVIKVSKEDRKLGLSIRALKEKQEVKAPVVVKQKSSVTDAKKTVAGKKTSVRKSNVKATAKATSNTSNVGVKSALQKALEEHAERMKEDDKPEEKK
jgi:small subunit ribosomal protein S1